MATPEVGSGEAVRRRSLQAVQPEPASLNLTTFAIALVSALPELETWHVQQLLINDTGWHWEWEWKWAWLWAWQPATRQWEWTPTTADDFGFKTGGPPLPTNVTVRLTGSCANFFVDELSPALRAAWAADLSARLGLTTRLSVPPPCFTVPTVPLPIASPPSAAGASGAPADIGSNVMTDDDLCKNNECLLWLLLLLCCCCCLPLCICARRRRRRQQLEETMRIDMRDLDELAFNDLVVAREALATALANLEKAQERARPDDGGLAELEDMEAYEIAVEKAERARVQLHDLEAKLPDPGETKSALRVRWDEYLRQNATEVRETGRPNLCTPCTLCTLGTLGTLCTPCALCTLCTLYTPCTPCALYTPPCALSTGDAPAKSSRRRCSGYRACGRWRRRLMTTACCAPSTSTSRRVRYA